MRYSPRARDSRAMRRMWLLIAAGAVCFCLTPIFPAGRAAFQLGATVLMAFGIYTAVRYQLTEFTYEITLRDSAVNDAAEFAGGTPDVRNLPAGMLDLVVRKAAGRRAAIIDACLSLGDLRYFALLPREGGREREPYKKFPELRTYDYTASVVPQAQYMAVFVDSAHNAIGLILEADEAFADLLTRAVQENEKREP